MVCSLNLNECSQLYSLVLAKKQEQKQKKRLKPDRDGRRTLGNNWLIDQLEEVLPAKRVHKKKTPVILHTSPRSISMAEHRKSMYLFLL